MRIGLILLLNLFQGMVTKIQMMFCNQMIPKQQYQQQDSVTGADHRFADERQPQAMTWLTTPLFAALLCSLCIHSLAVFAAFNLVPIRPSAEIRTLFVYIASPSKLPVRENSSETSPEAIIPQEHPPVPNESILSPTPEPVAAKLDDIPPPSQVQAESPPSLSPVRPAVKKLVSSRTKKVVTPEITPTASPADPLLIAGNSRSNRVEELPAPVFQQTMATAPQMKPVDSSEKVRPGNTHADIQHFRDQQLDNIGAKVMAVLQYPAMAKRMNWQGQASIGFILHPSGEVTNLVVEKSSGFPVLDKQAIAAVQAAAPFIGPTTQLTMTLPIRFHLD
jgi:periplasmic protein TonB